MMPKATMFNESQTAVRMISIDAENTAFFSKLGQGNVSEGIRRAGWILRGRAPCPAACWRSLRSPEDKRLGKR